MTQTNQEQAQARARRTNQDMAAKRRAELSKIHIGKKALGLDDDSYRAFLEKHTGKRSAAELNPKQIEAVIKAMQSAGAVFKSKKGGDPPIRVGEVKSALLKKITAILTSRGLSWNYAHAICKNNFKVERVEWLDTNQMRGLIAQLGKLK